jgi:hypothetical protein
MLGKSTLGRLVQLLNAARIHVSEQVANGLSRQRNVIAISKTEGGEPMLETAGVATHVFINGRAHRSSHERAVPGTPWYLACTEGSTAKHREHEVAVRRNRAV